MRKAYSEMEIYHSSYTSVEIPDISYSRDFLDFRKGFYLTTLYDQAVTSICPCFTSSAIKRFNVAELGEFVRDASISEREEDGL